MMVFLMLKMVMARRRKLKKVGDLKVQKKNVVSLEQTIDKQNVDPLQSGFEEQNVVSSKLIDESSNLCA
jgi:hypothetical protein